jgi:regulator of cell morphogenesis and NO signaling
MAPIGADSTVGALVAEQPARAKVFEEIGIDYCCGGNVPLEAACARRGLYLESVLQKLESGDAHAPHPEADWRNAPVAELTAHIVRTHHAYLRGALPRISQLADKVSAAHGVNDARLLRVGDLFETLRVELETHMLKEERILFPMCEELDGADELPEQHCGSVINPIRVMMAEHDEAGHVLGEMRRLTDDYSPPQTACNTYRALLQALMELEMDMHRHVHLENSILFPRAAALEEALAGR